MSIQSAWKIIKNTFIDLFANNVLKLSGALAFFTVFSLPGLLIIVIWFSDLFYRRELIEETIYSQIEGFVGHAAAMDIQETIQSATHATGNNVVTIIGLIVLLFGATSVFAEIQDSINHIWRLKPKPRKGLAWLKLIINRLLSFSMIIALGFILLVSLVINGSMEYLVNRLMDYYPGITSGGVYGLKLILTFCITSFIFGAIFKVLPDAQVEWRHVTIGACVTAALFMLGKFVISYYLGHSLLTTAYGATGSIIVVLFWVYYSSMILFFGAAFTREYAVYKGTQIYPNAYAVWVQQIEVESEKSIQKQPEQPSTVIEVPSEEK